MIKDCHVGIKGVVCMDGECLVVKSSNKDAYWDVPGGRVDDGESLPQTLTRELKEELPNIGDFKIKEVLGAYRLGKNIIDDRGLVLIFYKVEAEPFEITLSDEHSEYRWVTKDTISELKTDGVIDSDLYSILSSVLN